VHPASPYVSQLRRAWYLTARWLPHGWVDALRQLVLFGGAYFAYRLVRGIAHAEAGLAFQNARSIVGAERALHLFFEPGLQAALRGERWLNLAAVWMYVNSHFVVTTTFLIWLYLCRNYAYYFVRNMFLIGMGLALVGYIVFPAAPPRFLPEWGFTDSVASLFGPGAEHTANVLYNPFAAVPSMHVAFALMVAVPAIRLLKSRVVRVLWTLYPVVVTFVVMVTANHFWLDAVGGAAVAGASAWAASAGLARARPHAWAWRTAEAAA
jgi:PAP2 superfamily